MVCPLWVSIESFPEGTRPWTTGVGCAVMGARGNVMRFRILGIAGFVIAVVAAAALLTGLTAGVTLAEDVIVQSASPLGNKDAGKTETAIGDLVADAVRREARADIAFVAASELKPKDPPIPAGKVSSADVAALVSYSDDPLAVLQITGKSVKQALERSLSIYPQPNLGFLQVSGLSFTANPGAAAGSRVTSVTVGGSPLNDSATYTVAVTNSMANGALGYWKVWTEDQVKERRPDTNIVTAIQSYFKANPKIDYGTLDRITIR